MNQAQVIDLSHTIEDGLVTYPGLPAPEISDYLGRTSSEPHYTPGTTFQISEIKMVANTGTYLDAPFHRFAHGADLSQLLLESVAHREGIVVRAANSGRSLGPEVFQAANVRGQAVLIHTGWSRHWNTPRYGRGFPYLTESAGGYLVEAGAALVGIDSCNIDDDTDGRRPVHTTLLGANIPIVEHLCGLEALPDTGFTFFAVPPKIKGMGSFPVRAFAVL